MSVSCEVSQDSRQCCATFICGIHLTTVASIRFVHMIFGSFITAALAVLPPLVNAIRFSYPTSADYAYRTNLTFTKGDTVDVTWNIVDTDPKSFSLYLWEFEAFPPTYELVTYNVDTEAKQSSFTVPCRLNASPNWQLYVHSSLCQ